MESKINQNLKGLYQSKIGGLVALKEKYGDELDGPHMLYCWEQEYTAESNTKILFLGQENYGWYYNDGIYNEGICDNVEYGMCKYKDFALGAEYVKSPYWKYVHEINAHFNQGKKKNFLAANVSKFCAGGAPLDWETHKESVSHFDCLREEIKILNPDVIIFLSGPNYDDKIKIQFNEELEFTPLFEEIGVRELARIKSAGLPVRTYRTYHPGYLQRSSTTHYINLILSHIKNEKEASIVFDIKKRIQSKFPQAKIFFSARSDDGFPYYDLVCKFGEGEYELRLDFKKDESRIGVHICTQNREGRLIEIGGIKYENVEDYDYYGVWYYEKTSGHLVKTPTNDAEMKSLLDVVYPILESLSKELVVVSGK